MPVAAIADRQLSYQRRGSGEPLLLIQGMAGHAGTWGGPFLNRLAERFDVVAYEHRGIGESTDVPGPFTTADLAADALALLDVLGWARTHVMGISMGGMVAQELALAAGERVHTLVIGCSYCGGPGSSLDAPGPTQMVTAMNTRNAELAIRAAYRANLSRGFTDDPANWPPFRAAVQSVRVPVDVVLRQAQAAYLHDTSARLPALQVPTLVVAGTADEMVRPGNSEMIAGLIPGARAQLLDGIGHLFWWELPEQSAALVIGHCAG